MPLKKTILSAIILFTAFFPILFVAADFKYTPMVSIPGWTETNGKPSNFCNYIQAVYKFGVWTVGIAALFMIMFGGYTYLLSAGNAASAGNAKKYITDAIIGIVMAFTAYLLLYVINPDLLQIKYFCTS